MSELEIRSLGMVASRMLTNYLKAKEREEEEGGEMGDDDYFDSAYLEVIYLSHESHGFHGSDGFDDLRRARLHRRIPGLSRLVSSTLGMA